MASPRVKRQLPRPVEQIRILTWFQFHLSVVFLIVAIVAAAILSGQGGRPFLMYDDSARRGLAAVEPLMLALAGSAVLLATAAFLLRRGWAVALPLVFLAEVAVVVDVWLAVRAGLVASTTLGALTILFAIVLGLVSALLVILGGWIVARFFSGEVRTFLLRSPGT
jgi:hypothetical protein